MGYFILGMLVGIGVTFIGAPKLLKKLIKAVKDLNDAYNAPVGYSNVSSTSGGSSIISARPKPKPRPAPVDECVIQSKGGKVYINGEPVVPESQVQKEIVREEIPETEKEKIIASRVEKVENLLDSLYKDRDTVEGEILELKAQKEDVQEDLQESKEIVDAYNQSLKDIADQLVFDVNDTMSNIKNIVQDIRTDFEIKVKNDK